MTIVESFILHFYGFIFAALLIFLFIFHKMNVISLQVLLALAMFATTAFAGLIPIKVRKHLNMGQSLCQNSVASHNHKKPGRGRQAREACRLDSDTAFMLCGRRFHGHLFFGHFPAHQVGN